MLRLKLFLLLVGIMIWGAEAPSDFRKGSTANPVHIFKGTSAVQKIYKGNTLIWQNTSPPAITSFAITPSTIDLDTRPTGTISFSLGVTGTPGTTTATASDVTFVLQSEGTISEHFAFITNVAGHTAIGSSTLSNNNFVSTEFLTGSGWAIGRRHGYQSGFLESFLKNKNTFNY